MPEQAFRLARLMPIQVDVLYQPENPEPSPATVTLADSGGTIGRKRSCDLVLHDESRYVSSQHATLAVVDGQIQITDTSSNGTFVNAETRPIGRDNTRVLADGDRLTMGDFELQVRLASAGSVAAQPRQDAASARQNQEPQSAADESLDDLLSNLGPRSKTLAGFASAEDPKSPPEEPAPAAPAKESAAETGPEPEPEVEATAESGSTDEPEPEAAKSPEPEEQAAAPDTAAEVAAEAEEGDQAPDTEDEAQIAPARETAVPEADDMPAVGMSSPEDDAAQADFDALLVRLREQREREHDAISAALRELLAPLDPTAIEQQSDAGDERERQAWRRYRELHQELIGGEPGELPEALRHAIRKHYAGE